MTTLNIGLYVGRTTETLNVVDVLKHLHAVTGGARASARVDLSGEEPTLVYKTAGEVTRKLVRLLASAFEQEAIAYATDDVGLVDGGAHVVEWGAFDSRLFKTYDGAPWHRGGYWCQFADRSAQRIKAKSATQALRSAAHATAIYEADVKLRG